MLLVSILDYLLVQDPYAPKTRKIQVDKIKKQFVEKTSRIVLAEGSYRETATLNKTLADLYEYRSSVAHGSYVNNLDLTQLYRLVLLMYEVLKIVVGHYIKHRPFVDNLKDLRQVGIKAKR